MGPRLHLLIALLSLPITSSAWAVERIQLKAEGRPPELVGKVLTEAEDGGILLLTPDGMTWILQPQEITERKHDDQPFVPMKREEITKRILADLPSGFKVYTTVNYVICYNTSPAYAQWCGTLFERLYRGFQNYWETRGFKLKEPELPLVALIFEGKESYTRFVRSELGDAATSIVGFYSPTTNRVNMYDLTGLEELRMGNDRSSSLARINQILSQPAAAPTVATIVHEATHQLAYNCGLQTRLADNPVWVSEGLAVYFETPDLKNSKGWGSIGAVNRGRLLQFRKYLARRPDDSLHALIRDDKRFKAPTSALDAYAEAWALNYYLLRTKSKEYVAYLRQLSTKQPSLFDKPEERLQAFAAAFGDDLQKFDQEFLRYMRRVE